MKNEYHFVHIWIWYLSTICMLLFVYDTRHQVLHIWIHEHHWWTKTKNFAYWFDWFGLMAFRNVGLSEGLYIHLKGLYKFKNIFGLMILFIQSRCCFVLWGRKALVLRITENWTLNTMGNKIKADTSLPFSFECEWITKSSWFRLRHKDNSLTWEIVDRTELSPYLQYIFGWK